MKAKLTNELAKMENAEALAEHARSSAGHILRQAFTARIEKARALPVVIVADGDVSRDFRYVAGFVEGLRYYEQLIEECKAQINRSKTP